MEQFDRIRLLQELISCNQELFYWCYDSQKQLMESTCPNMPMLDILFRRSDCLDYAYSVEDDAPLLLGNKDGLTWIAVRELEGTQLAYLHTLGPFFVNSKSLFYLEKMLKDIRFSNGSTRWKESLAEYLQTLPTISVPVYCQYATMLYYCVTQKKANISSIRFQTSMDVSRPFPDIPRDRLLIYQAERQLLQVVRDGDISNKDSHRNASSVAQLQPYVEDPLMQTQIACTIFTTLCSRAAIEGGLSSEEAYSLGDKYIKSAFLAKTPSEVTGLNSQMYDDFIQRVHRCRTNPRYSKIIQSCCDYIELHVEDDLSIEILATRLGYTKYYLSRCFKEETRCSVNDYIKIARIERAKLLLSTTSLSIPEITDRLRFCTRSHFSDIFKRFTGKSPAQYRSEFQHL